MKPWIRVFGTLAILTLGCGFVYHTPQVEWRIVEIVIFTGLVIAFNYVKK